MRNLVVSLLLAISYFSFGQANWNNTSFVHRDGQLVRDGLNNVISLEGVNLGGWLMWEGWIWNGGFTQQRTIYNSIENKVGTPAAEAFRDSVYWNYITEADIAAISNECYNVVRIPFNHKLLEDDFTPYTYKPEGWRVLDSVLAWCERYNVFAVLDLHSAPGGQSWLFTADPDPVINLWNGAINQNRTVELWKAIADRYKDRGIIAGYDLLNEPDPSDDQVMLDLYQEIIDSIRTVDQNHMVILEGSNFASDFSIFTGPIDPNMMYEFHLYTWFISDIAAEIVPFSNLSSAHNVPIWCGEWGENSYMELDTTLALFRDIAFGMSGSAFWTWKKAKRQSPYPYYNGVDTTALWNKSIEWISNNTLPEPTPAEMQTGMDEFIQNIKLANCIFNDTLSDILNSCSVNAVSELALQSIRIYPNPTSGKFIVQSNLAGECIVRDLAGRIVAEGKLNEEIDLSDQKSGIFFVRVNDRVVKVELIK